MSICSRLFKKKTHFFWQEKNYPKDKKKKSPGIIKDNNPYILSFDLTESLVFFIYREWQKKKQYNWHWHIYKSNVSSVF